MTARSFSYVAQTYAYRIKRGAFAEEHEWRLIYTRDPKGSLPPASRALDLGLADLHLREVRVGPTAHPEIAELAMRCLLDDADLGSIEVTSTAIPLRA